MWTARRETTSRWQSATRDGEDGDGAIVDSCLHRRTDGTEDDAFLGTGGELGIRARGASDARDASDASETTRPRRRAMMMDDG